MKKLITVLFISTFWCYAFSSCTNLSTASSVKDSTLSQISAVSVMNIKSSEVAPVMTKWSTEEKTFVPSSCVTVSDLKKIVDAAKELNSDIIRFSIVKDTNGKNGTFVNFYGLVDSKEVTPDIHRGIPLGNCMAYLPDKSVYKIPKGFPSDTLSAFSLKGTVEICCPPRPTCIPDSCRITISRSGEL